MSLRLLLADDHPLIREGLRSSFVNQGFTVVAEAEDGKRAVDLALEHRPDVVVMDIGMPELDGIEATRRIMRQRPGSKVLMLTAHDDDGMRQAAQLAGALGYVSKTAATAEIADAVRALARGESVLSKTDVLRPAGYRPARFDRYFGENLPPEPRLTRRESQVLQLFANGRATVEVAKTLGISQKTVKNHLTSIYQKLNVRDRTEAVLLAVRDRKSVV